MIFPKSHSSKFDEAVDLTGDINRPYRKDAWKTAKDFLASFKYAFHGLIYAFKSQRNFRFHVFAGLLVSCISLTLKLPLAYLAIIVIAIASVLILELINTSIEIESEVPKSTQHLAQFP